MPKSTHPPRETGSQRTDGNVVTLSSSQAVSVKASEPSAESDAQDVPTSERWASAIVALMQVERSRFQEMRENVPSVQITSLETMGITKDLSTGSTQKSLKLRKERSAREDSEKEDSKIQPLHSPKKVKS